MKEQQIFDALRNIDPALAAIGAPDGEQRGKKRNRLRNTLLVASLCAVSLTATGVALEAREYASALEYFSAHNLSTEGMTRLQIKEAFRNAPGEESGVSSLTSVSDSENGIVYQPDGVHTAVTSSEFIDFLRKKTPDLQFICESSLIDGERRTELKYYEGGEVIWSEILPLEYAQVFETNLGALVVGSGNPPYDRSSREQTVLLYSPEKELLCQTVLTLEAPGYSAYWLPDGNGNFTLFFKYPYSGYGRIQDGECFTLSGDCVELEHWKIEDICGEYARLGDGFVQWRGSTVFRYRGKDGTKKDLASPIEFLKSQYGDSRIFAAIEYNGKLFLSLDTAKVRDERQISYADSYDLCSELDRFEEHTAVLLMYDPETESYTVIDALNGVIADALYVKDGTLFWDVGRLGEIMYYPEANAFSAIGTFRVTCFAYDETFRLVDRIDPSRVFVRHWL